VSSLLELQRAAEQAAVRGDVAALEACSAALEANDTIEGRALQARVRGQIAYMHSDYDAAFAHYTQSNLLFEELADLRGIAGTLANIGSVHFRRGSYAEALDHYERALLIHTQCNDAAGVARICNNIALVHTETGNFPAALEGFHRALDFHQQHNNKRGIALTTGNIGMVFNATGSYPDALRQYHEALAVYEELNEMPSAAGVLGNIGNVHNTTGNFTTALDYYQRSYDLHELVGSRTGMANVLGNMGNAFSNLHDYPQALEHMRRSLDEYQFIGDPAGYAAIASNQLIVLLSAKQYDDARAALDVLDTMQVDEPPTRVTREIGRSILDVHSGSLDAALHTLQTALDLATEYGLRKEQADLHKRLRDLCQHTNDFAGYIEHNNAFTQVQEEINGKDVSVRLAMQDKQREIDAKDREVQKHMAVLHSTLPKHVAERVARGEVVNDSFDDAAVLFLDVVGFTTLSSSRSASEVVGVLQEIFTAFDAVCATHNVIKTKTIGDAYMAVAFPDDDNTQYERLAHCALDMLNVNAPSVSFRIGLHCGPIVAGVLGTERLQYDVWGDTVNVASRMESTGAPGRVHVSEAFAINLEEKTRVKNQESNQESHEVPLVTSERGMIDIKGKGLLQTYWLERA